jgi:hypothetical protein
MKRRLLTPIHVLTTAMLLTAVTGCSISYYGEASTDEALRGGDDAASWADDSNGMHNGVRP